MLVVKKQVDVLPSALFKVKLLLINCYSIVVNGVMSKSREQRPITKEHIATHTNLILPLYAPVL